MRKELQDYLIKKYPKIYTEVGENEPFDLFGFECNDGWFRLILWLSRYIEQYIEQQNTMSEKFPNNYLPVKQLKAVQVKEKFGTLRYYYSGGNEHLSNIITYTEYLSGFICEQTGKTNDVGYNRTGWIKTHHVELSKNKRDFFFLDDVELRDILKNDPNQLKLNI